MLVMVAAFILAIIVMLHSIALRSIIIKHFKAVEYFFQKILRMLILFLEGSKLFQMKHLTAVEYGVVENLQVF